MNYLLDTNALMIRSFSKKGNFFVIEDILKEYNAPDARGRLQRNGIKIRDLDKFHITRLPDVMEKEGDNLELINLSTGKGMVDVIQIAYVLGERDKDQGKLIKEEWIIVTDDKPLVDAANRFSIPCISSGKL